MANRVTRRSLLGSFLAVTAGAELLRPQPAGAQRGRPTDVIPQVNKQFLDAVRKGDAAGCAAVYSTTARLMPPNSPVQTGHKAIQAFWDGAIKSGLKGATLTTEDLDVLKNTVIEIGTYTLDIEPPGKPPKQDKGKYVVVWKRHEALWRIAVDIFNSDLPVA